MGNDRIPLVVAEWSADPWAMEPSRLNAMFARLADVADRPLLAAIVVDTPPAKLQVIEGTATIPIKGLLLKTVPGWLKFFGIDATAYSDIRRLVAEAVADAGVQRIELAVESPGGQVSGAQETAEAIRDANVQKPVTAVVEDLAASAAYWLASQAATISANPNAFIGSIGVYTVYADFSKMAADEGVTVHVIRSGEHKGMGVMGAAITPNQIAAMQENIDGIANHFNAAVAAGRALSMDETKSLATGRLWEADAALSLKLIDSVGTVPPNRKSQIVNGKSLQGESTMENTNQQAAPTVAPAVDLAKERAAAVDGERKRLAEFKAAFPGDLEFAVASFESGVTLDQAKASNEIMAKRIKASARVETTGADGRIGQQASEGNEGTAGEGKDFMAASRQYAAEHKCSMTEAMKQVRISDPALHQKFLAAERERPLSVHSGGKAAGRVSL